MHILIAHLLTVDRFQVRDNIGQRNGGGASQVERGVSNEKFARQIRRVKTVVLDCQLLQGTSVKGMARVGFVFFLLAK